MSEPTSLRWFLSGAAGLASVPAAILMTSFLGFGALCRASGVGLGEAVFMTAAIWALPSQLVLVGALASGTSLPAAALAVSLSAVRFAPMLAAWVPLVRGERTPLWKLLALSHFVAITSWVWSARFLPALPVKARVPYFAGFAVALTTANVGVTAISFVLTPALPAAFAAGLLFLTPIYFTTALSAAARDRVETYALPIGLLLGPLLKALGAPLSMLFAGLVGGTLAWGLARRGSGFR